MSPDLSISLLMILTNLLKMSQNYERSKSDDQDEPKNTYSRSEIFFCFYSERGLVLTSVLQFSLWKVLDGLNRLNTLLTCLMLGIPFSLYFYLSLFCEKNYYGLCNSKIRLKIELLLWWLAVTVSSISVGIQQNISTDLPLSLSLSSSITETSCKLGYWRRGNY